MPLAALSSGPLLMISVYAISTGMIVNDRQDAQHAADVAAIAAAEHIRMRGLTGAGNNINGIITAGESNESRANRRVRVSAPNWQEVLAAPLGDGAVLATVQADVDTPMPLGGVNASTVDAQAIVDEHVALVQPADDGSPADVVFALDYSSSMNAPLAFGETLSRAALLGVGIKRILNKASPDINFSAVFFNERVIPPKYQVDPFSEQARDSIKDNLNDTKFVASGATNHAAALSSAADAARKSPNGNKFVVLVSDGCTTFGGDPAQSAELVYDTGATIVSLQLGDIRGDCEEFLRELAGDDDNRGNSDFYFKAHTGAQLLRQFNSIFNVIGGGGTCEVAVLNNPPVLPLYENSIRVFFRDAQGLIETPVDPDMYSFDRLSGSVRITDQDFCAARANDGSEMVTRYNYARLVQ